MSDVVSLFSLDHLVEVMLEDGTLRGASAVEWREDADEPGARCMHRAWVLYGGSLPEDRPVLRYVGAADALAWVHHGTLPARTYERDEARHPSRGTTAMHIRLEQAERFARAIVEAERHDDCPFCGVEMMDYSQHAEGCIVPEARAVLRGET